MQPRKTTTDSQSTSSHPAPFGQVEQGDGYSSYSRKPSHQEIAKRAFEIYNSGKAGSEHENWFRAERELKAA